MSKKALIVNLQYKNSSEESGWKFPDEQYYPTNYVRGILTTNFGFVDSNITVVSDNPAAEKKVSAPTNLVENGTKDTIVTQLTTLMTGVGDSDVRLIIFTGHGFAFDEDGSSNYNTKGYFVCTDVSANKTSITKENAASKNLLAGSAIQKIITDKVADKKVNTTFIANCCHGAALLLKGGASFKSALESEFDTVATKIKVAAKGFPTQGLKLENDALMQYAAAFWYNATQDKLFSDDNRETLNTKCKWIEDVWQSGKAKPLQVKKVESALTSKKTVERARELFLQANQWASIFPDYTGPKAFEDAPCPSCLAPTTPRTVFISAVDAGDVVDGRFDFVKHFFDAAKAAVTESSSATNRQVWERFFKEHQTWYHLGAIDPVPLKKLKSSFDPNAFTGTKYGICPHMLLSKAPALSKKPFLGSAKPKKSSKERSLVGGQPGSAELLSDRLIQHFGRVPELKQFLQILKERGIEYTCDLHMIPWGDLSLPLGLYNYLKYIKNSEDHHICPLTVHEGVKDRAVFWDPSKDLDAAKLIEGTTGMDDLLPSDKKLLKLWSSTTIKYHISADFKSASLMSAIQTHFESGSVNKSSMHPMYNFKGSFGATEAVHNASTAASMKLWNDLIKTGLDEWSYAMKNKIKFEKYASGDDPVLLIRPMTGTEIGNVVAVPGIASTGQFKTPAVRPYLMASGGMSLDSSKNSPFKVGGCIFLNTASLIRVISNQGNMDFAYSTVLHEVGHFLGLLHEHTKNGIPVTITSIGDFNQDALDGALRSCFDVLSVMHYPKQLAMDMRSKLGEAVKLDIDKRPNVAKFLNGMKTSLNVILGVTCTPTWADVDGVFRRWGIKKEQASDDIPGTYLALKDKSRSTKLKKSSSVDYEWNVMFKAEVLKKIDSSGLKRPGEEFAFADFNSLPPPPKQSSSWCTYL